MWQSLSCADQMSTVEPFMVVPLLSADVDFTNPYNLFTKVNRPKLPTNLKNAEREKLLGQMWRATSKEGRAAYQPVQPGWALPQRTGHGGTRAWVSTQGEEPPPPQAAREISRQQGTSLVEDPTTYSTAERLTQAESLFERLTQADRWARAKKECPWSLSNLQPALDPEVLEPPAKRRATAGGVMDVNSKVITHPYPNIPSP